MKQFKKVVLTIVAIFSLTVVAAGCGNAANKSATSSTTTASKSTSKSAKMSAKSRAMKKSTTSTDNVNVSDSAQNGQQGNSTSTSPSGQATSSNGSSVKATTSSNVQLGLGDVASWTDSKGVTHNVDSDGMDRQVKNGQTSYADWSGPLPSNVVVTHNK